MLPSFELVIPRHCLAEDTTIRISLHLFDPLFACGIKEINLLSPIIRIQPAKLHFYGVVHPMLRLPLLELPIARLYMRDAGLNKSKMVLLYRKSPLSPWKKEYCKFLLCDYNETKCVSFPLRHFSYNVVAYEERPQQPD